MGFSIEEIAEGLKGFEGKAADLLERAQTWEAAEVSALIEHLRNAAATPVEAAPAEPAAEAAEPEAAAVPEAAAPETEAEAASPAAEPAEPADAEAPADATAETATAAA